MSDLSKYWKLMRIDAASGSNGYKLQLIPPAQAFFATQFPNVLDRITLSEMWIQQHLFRQLQDTDGEGELSLYAELCLRCSVSYLIVQACLKRARLFGSGHGFTYRDLLPFVLNDDGKLHQRKFIPFSVEILHSFTPEHQCSLAGWVDLRVKRNRELNQFLLEFGLRFSSDWALLNRAKPKQLEGIDRALVEVFHAVYRRDRPQQHRQGIRQKCCDPTQSQLQEMLHQLRQQQILVHSPRSLLSQLKLLAQELRQQEIWGQRGAPVAESLDLSYETGEGVTQAVFDRGSPLDLIEEQELHQLQAVCRQQLLTCLDAGIQQGIADRISSLQQRRRYACFAQLVRPALQLLYGEGKSQTEIASLLGMTNQSQVSRVLDLKELLLEVRRCTLEKLLEQLLETARSHGFSEITTQAEYFTNLVQHLNDYLDTQVFQDAFAELTTSKHRLMNSLYAQRMRLQLDEHLSYQATNL